MTMTGTTSAGLVGREEDLARLGGLLAELMAGRGGLAWVEGEPGIGKTALLVAGFAGAEPGGCRVFWGACEELAQRLPLGVLTQCLQVREGSADPERAEIAGLLRGRDSAGPGPLDVVAAAVQRLVGWVEQAAVAAPVLLVLDDVQWADDASLLVLVELARLVGQLPLLLAVACRPVPRRAELVAARRAVLSHGAVQVSVGPLPAEQVSVMVSRLLGAEPGPALRSATAQAGGNPLYVREIVDALVREKRTRVRGGRAEVDATAVAPLPSPTAAIADRLDFLSEQTAGVLRLAALLGAEFAVEDLAVVAGRDAVGLVPVVEEAVAAGVLGGSGSALAFRHELIRQAFAVSMPAALRSALHGQVARTLVDSGAGVERVGAQLLAAADGGLLSAGWVVDWLATAGLRLAYRAGPVAIDLLQGALREVPAGDPARETLAGHLLTALWLQRRDEELEPLGRRVIAHGRDGQRVAQAAWMLASALRRASRYDDAAEAAAKVLADPRIGGAWGDRLRSTSAVTLLALGRFDEAEAVARQMQGDSGRVPDRYARAEALHVLSMLQMRTRDLVGAVASVDLALDLLGEDLEGVDLRLLLLANRAGMLLSLDRIEDAGRALAAALRLAEQSGSLRLPVIRTTAGEYLFMTGQWDEALAELTATDPVHFSLPLIDHGVPAMIALHRGDRTGADGALAALAGRSTDRAVDRASSRYLIAARALVAERDGHPEQAVATLRTVLDPPLSTDMQERWMLLPDLVRAALAAGDPALAQAAGRASAAEAEHDGATGQRTAADHSRGLLTGDPALLLTVADWYGALPRPLEAAQAAEDAAAVHAQRGDTTAARAALATALDRYAALGAQWDIDRARARFRGYGIRRTLHTARQRRPATGWDSLSPAETKVASLISEGLSNPQIANRLFLSRRTVEIHVSHILGKLGLRSRTEVARDAAQHPSPPPPPTQPTGESPLGTG